MVLLLPRFRLHWPPPDSPYNQEVQPKHPVLAAPKPALPHLLVRRAGGGGAGQRGWECAGVRSTEAVLWEFYGWKAGRS